MIKISKSVEYSILALKYISDHGDVKISSSTIANDLNIPYDLLAKLLQKLVKKGIIKSEQGKYGGYSLIIPTDKLTIMEIITSLEENIQLTNCSFQEATIESCGRINSCNIRSPFMNLQNRINEMFESITLYEISN